MKAFLVSFFLLPLTVFAGDMGSGGTQGKQFLSCSGNLHNGETVYVKVVVRSKPVVGIYAHASTDTGSVLVDEKVVKEGPSQPSPFSLRFTNGTTTISVPNMQSKNQPVGTFKAVLVNPVVNHGQSVVLTCNK